jgi:hypothetical protein
MKQLFFLLCLCSIFACKQAASDSKQNDTTAKDAGTTDRPLSIVSSIMIEHGGAVVPNPTVSRYTFTNSHPDGDLHQVFFALNESNNTGSLYDGIFALSMEQNTKVYDLLEKVSAIENGKKFDQKGEPCVGSRGRTYKMTYFDGKNAAFEVTPDAMCQSDKLPADLRELNDLAGALAQELKAQTALPNYKKMVGKTWVSDADPTTTVTFVDGRMNETIKGVDNPPTFFRLSDNCTTAKDREGGMSAGNLGCITSWAQDEVEYMITGIGDKYLEFKQMGTDKMQSYTLKSEKTKR